VGTALATLATGRGVEVVGLRRHPRALGSGIETIAADLLDPGSLGSVPDDIDSLVYAVSPADSSDEAYADAYVRGLDHLIGRLVQTGAPVERLVVVSSTGVYGQADGEWVDEHSATSAAHPSSARLLEGERQALASPWSNTVLRLGGIYGPGRTRLIEEVRAGRARRSAAPKWSNRMHRDDCAGALLHLLELDQAEELYIGVDREPALLDEVQAWIARALGVAEPPAGSAEIPQAGRRARSNKRCRSDRLVASGFHHRFPTYREGYRALLDAQGETGRGSA
jgi:nucleoside-diphosphate-sugar epimerase